MGRTLAYTVHVNEMAPVDPKDPDGEKRLVATRIFERGTQLPAWAEEFVGDHAFEPEPADEPEPEPDGGDGGSPEPARPAGNASLEAWQEYARSQGASEADLDGKGRDDLRDTYGK